MSLWEVDTIRIGGGEAVYQVQRKSRGRTEYYGGVTDNREEAIATANWLNYEERQGWQGGDIG